MKRRKNEKKMLAVASSGGHWVQLMRLTPLLAKYDVTYITTNYGKDKHTKEKIYDVIDANNSERLKCLYMFFQVFKIVLFTRPDIVISTGAAPGVFAITLSKLFSAKTIWLDSIANAEKISLSARLVERFADVRLTQWEHLVDADNNMQYWGKVI